MAVDSALEHVLMADARIDPDKFMFESIDTSEKPVFTVSEAAKFFFARTAHWMRWRERNLFFLLGDDPTCEHHEKKPKTIVKDGKKVKTIKIMSWVRRGKCTKCGAVEVGGRTTKTGSRVYSLGDIEQIAHALARRNAITGGQLRNTLSLLAIQARLWEYL
jgi:hypothetical protein